MSTMLTTRHQTQIVVSPDSDDEERESKAYVVGPSASNLTRTAASSSPHHALLGSAAASGLHTSLGQDGGVSNPLSHKYPHTRSALVAIIREYRPDGDASEYGDEADGLLQQVVGLLRDENEDELKSLMKNNLDIGDDAAEQFILDLMHSHRDDMNQAPLTILSATKRPISRPSSRASSHSFRLNNRPESPLASYVGSAPSSPKPIQLGFRRPHTPVTTSPLVGLHANSTPSGSYMTVPNSSVSPASSPPLPHSVVLNLAAASPSSSPLSSPRFLNAKEFRPSRPLSIGSNPGTPSAETPGGNPTSVWSTSVPPSSLTRTSSNLAVVTPRSGTPINRDALPSSRPGSSLARPGSSLAVPSKPPFDDEDDDEFSPFSKPKTILYKSRADMASSNAVPPAPTSSEGTGESASEQSGGGEEDGYLGYSYTEFVPSKFVHGDEMGGEEDYPYLDQQRYAPPRFGDRYPRDEKDRIGGEKDKDFDPNVPEGMTPLEVLVSVFGATMSPAELENVLAGHGWNFEDAMAYLVDKNANGPNVGPGPGPERGPLSRSNSGMMDERGSTFVGRQGMGPSPGRGMGFGPGSGGKEPRRMERPGRVCRYFLAGECLRADCRFSHDLDRALCRFWLRGVCAKGDQCEFMHRLPPNMDRHAFQIEGGRRSPMPMPQGPPPFVVNPNINGMDRRGVLDDRTRMADDGEGEEDDFPALGSAPDERGGMSRSSSSNDPSRSRFASAVKKPNQSSSTPASILVTGSTFAISPSPSLSDDPTSLSPPFGAAIPTPTPKPSPRINLRPPTNLPTIPTGDALNKLYTTYRERPLQLQAARNACLARAADAWRRGDGAGAKRFSRDANELNGKMNVEGRESAGRLVRERGRVLREAVLPKGSSGRFAGGGLGVLLGPSKDPGTKGETEEMRMEIALDLHGLHAAEGVDYLEELVLALENERFLGLTYVIIGEEKHTGTQDPARGASKLRLASAVKEWLHRWGYPWNEWNGIICVDCLTHY